MAFAEIISESEVPNDWGGEQFDLWSTVISVEGQRLRTAIAFKGPARFRPMTIASLGKNGDQIDRLAQTAADLMVVQHCHTITAPVVNMLKAYASNFRDPKRYMLIDGSDTIRILRHFGYLSLPRRATGAPARQGDLRQGSNLLARWRSRYVHPSPTKKPGRRCRNSAHHPGILLASRDTQGSRCQFREF